MKHQHENENFRDNEPMSDSAVIIEKAIEVLKNVSQTTRYKKVKFISKLIQYAKSESPMSSVFVKVW